MCTLCLLLRCSDFYFPWENVRSSWMWAWCIILDPFHWLLHFFVNWFLLVTNVLGSAGIMETLISKYIYCQSYPSCWDALVTLSRVSPVWTFSHISLLSLENLYKYFHDHHFLSIFVWPLCWCFSKECCWHSHCLLSFHLLVLDLISRRRRSATFYVIMTSLLGVEI